ncbi:L-threonine dehydratase catabolic tdcb-like [Plakobranchus ocellatus]|uniref:L-serine deaminase n=1 Tax=Plakobranchus ocellatus TaxID=259542 RepID=A0AAV3Z3B1_9GAST|nr:L-threonine dehydratase catabolic tdcb-like [Plakobranchus ocellatus]
MPDHAPEAKVKATLAMGASVTKVTFDQWYRVVVNRKFDQFQGIFIHPASDAAVIAGNGTIGLEILEDVPNVDTIIAPYGGGSLSSGIAIAAKGIKPSVKAGGRYGAPTLEAEVHVSNNGCLKNTLFLWCECTPSRLLVQASKLSFKRRPTLKAAVHVSDNTCFEILSFFGASAHQVGYLSKRRSYPLSFTAWSFVSGSVGKGEGGCHYVTTHNSTDVAARTTRPVLVFACEVDTAAPLSAAFKAGKPVKCQYTPNFVDGMGSSGVLAEMWPLVKEKLDGSLVISLSQVAEAVKLLANKNHVIAEGAGAAPVAAALTADAGEGNIVCVVSGGNIDPNKLIHILQGLIPAQE